MPIRDPQCHCRADRSLPEKIGHAMIEPVYLLVKLTPGSVARARQAIHDRIPVVSDAVYSEGSSAYYVLQKLLEDTLQQAKREAARQTQSMSMPGWKYEERSGDPDHITLIVGNLRYRIRRNPL